MKNLHANARERLSDLSNNEAFENCMTYSEEFFVKGTIETHRMKNEEVTVIKSNRLSLKKRIKNGV